MQTIENMRNHEIKTEEGVTLRVVKRLKLYENKIIRLIS